MDYVFWLILFAFIGVVAAVVVYWRKPENKTPERIKEFGDKIKDKLD